MRFDGINKSGRTDEENVYLTERYNREVMIGNIAGWVLFGVVMVAGYLLLTY
jgi:hypothetical protein